MSRAGTPTGTAEPIAMAIDALARCEASACNAIGSPLFWLSRR